MNKTILAITLLPTLFLIAACSGSTLQTPSASSPTKEAATPTKTAVPPTATPTATVTLPPATETPPARNTPATEAVNNTVSYVNQVMPIIEAKCIKCHGVETKKEGLDLRTYNDLMAGSRNGPVLTPGDADNSLLVQLIQRGKMPNRGPKVTPEELQLIMDWVNQGALNN